MPLFQIKRIVVAGLLAAVCLCGGSTPAQAGTFPVTTTADTGAGSLRAAIDSANSNADASNITFDPTVFSTKKTIKVDSDLPGFTANVIVTGPAAGVTIDGFNRALSLFLAYEGVQAEYVGLTVTRGNYGISNQGTTTITRCTLNNNTIGVFNSPQGSVTVTNSTISGNYSHGLYSYGTANVHSSTLSSNEFGIRNFGTLNVQNSIVAGNASAFTNIVTDEGTFNDIDHNLIGGDPKLGALQDNGGPTFTMLPASDSPAINQGSSNEATDQRGVPRPQNGTDDIGAVESLGALEGGSLVVSTTADTDDGNYSAGNNSLREAIKFANSIPDSSDITFNIPGDGPHTIQLASALPDLSTSINFIGPTTEKVSIRGEGASDAYRIFTILSGKTVGIENLTLSNGKSPQGGAIWNNGGTLNLTSSTISGNSAVDTGYGGGIANSGTATVTNSTISGNSVTGGLGGGIFSNGASLTINSSTITANTAGNGGGINKFAGTLSVSNSIVSGNTATTNANISGTRTGSNNIVDTNAKLGELTDNGGPTATHLPAPDSPAIDMGASDENTDQRGVSRPQGAADDIGSVEVAVTDGPNFVVTVTEDSDNGNYAANDISLREAINFANANANQSNITFDPTAFADKQTITVNSALPGLSTPVSIKGSASGVTVAGSLPNFNLFTVNSGGTGTFTDLTITNGSTGIHNEGTANVNNSTITNNGRGIDNNTGGATVNVSNSTFNGNDTHAIYNVGTAKVTNATISGNGIGITNNGTATLKNTIVTNNANGNTPGVFNPDSSNIIGGDAKLGPLKDNGGPTFTMALLADSPAINPDTSSGAPATDQRGVARVSTPDIGAYESNVVSTKQTGPDFVVTNTSEPGDGVCDIAGAGDGCTLREAMSAANANADASKITFASGVSGDIQLVGELPTLTTAVTITGPVAGGITILGAGARSGTSFRVNSGGDLTLTNVTIKNSGSAIFNAGTLSVANCTFNDNATALQINSGLVTVTNCTFTTCLNVIVNAATVNVTNCTIVGNRFAFLYQNGTVNVKNSILASNEDNGAGSFTDGGNNIIGGDPKLGPLKDNGGPTFTMLPASDSPAINAGSSTGAPSTDQRGVLRPQGAGIDIGAVETLGALEGGSLVVSTTDDLDDGDYSANHNSLREAIKFANAFPDTSAITFDATVFNTAKTITIGTAAYAAANDLFLTQDVTITGPAARVTIAGANRNNNIFNINGEVTATFVNLSIANSNSGLLVGGTANLINTTISGCHRGILNYGTANVSNSTIQSNDSEGIRTESGKTVNVSNSTISSNGSGIISNGGSINATNSTISFNGIGVSVFGSANILNCTISSNSSYNFRNAGTSIVKNTIIAGSNPAVTGTLSTGSGNNITTTTVAEAGLDAGGLKDNGGPTKTIALIEGSPAIDTGTATGAPDKDQRGVLRPQGAGVDIGAYELQSTPPTLLDVAVSTNEDAAYTFSAATFDAKFSDAQNDTLQKVKILSLPSSGTLKLNNVAVTLNQEIARADLGTLVYTPASNFNGADSFGYNASDGTAYAATGKSVNITINAVNDAPTLSDIAVSTDEDTALTFAQNSFDAGFSDAEGNTLQKVKITSLPAAAKGALSLGGVAVTVNQEIARADLGTLVYTPAPNFNGADSFGYNASDGTAYAATGKNVNITVKAVNDAPVATDTSVNTNEDTAKDIDLAALVSDDNTADANLIYEIVAAPATGTGTIVRNGSVVTYTPPQNYHATASFTYKVTDAGGLVSATKKVSITVDAVNDPPVFNPTSLEFNTSEGQLVNFFSSASDPDTGAVLEYSLVGAPTGASINSATGEFRWTPSESQGGQSFAFQIKVKDGAGGEALQSITINVAEVNAPPVMANIGSRSVGEMTNLSFTVSASDSDLPADTLTFSATGSNGAALPSGASFNAATRQFSWTPSEAQGPGTYYIVFKVSDGKGGQDSKTATIFVNEVNQPPILDLGGNRTLVGGQSFSFRVSASDPDLPPQGYSLYPINPPSWIGLTADGPTVYGTPPVALAPYTANLTIRAGDYFGGTTDKSIILTVNPPRVVWLVQPSWSATEGTLVYRLKNNTGAAITGIYISGTLFTPVKSIDKTIGNATSQALGNGRTGVYWSGFSLPNGGEASMTIKVPRPAPGTHVAQTLYCSFAPTPPATLTTLDVFAP